MLGDNRNALYPYNPGRGDSDALRELFTGREALLADRLDELREGRDASVNQHGLITAPWGMGKTHFLTMIRYAVEEDEILSQAYLPVQLSEEEYTIANLRDFLLRIIEGVWAAESMGAGGAADPTLTADPALTAARATIQSLSTEDGIEEAIAALKAYGLGKEKKILILADNFDQILGAQLRDDAEIGRLRDLLMNESFLVVLATARADFKEVTGYDRPFYNFFKPLTLEALAPEEMVELVDRLSAWEARPASKNSPVPLRPLIHTAHHLLGGNPRMAMLLYRHLVHDTGGNAPGILLGVLDDLTPVYKARWGALSPQLRQVVDLFARMEQAATPTELASQSRLPVNQVNSILKRLREMGLVGIGAQKRRKTTLYQVWDRPFRLWHACRTSQEGARRAEGLIAFTFLWYSRTLAPDKPDDWERLCPDLAASAQAMEEENAGLARTLFQTALKALRAEGKDETPILFGFFLRIMREEGMLLCEDLMHILAEEMPSSHGVFKPFRHALHYWRNGRDREILDRLPPEMRILVEAFLKMDDEQ